MSISALSSAASGASAQLVKLANGEYTAASVTADPKDALKLALVKEKDGNYGTTAPSSSASATAASQSSPASLSALSSLTLGGE